MKTKEYVEVVYRGLREQVIKMTYDGNPPDVIKMNIEIIDILNEIYRVKNFPSGTSYQFMGVPIEVVDDETFNMFNFVIEKNGVPVYAHYALLG